MEWDKRVVANSAIRKHKLTGVAMWMTAVQFNDNKVFAECPDCENLKWEGTSQEFAEQFELGD